MEGQTTPTLAAWSLGAAGTHDRRHHPVFLRRAHLLAMRMRCGHLWACADRIVQRGYRLRLKTELTPTASRASTPLDAAPDRRPLVGVDGPPGEHGLDRRPDV